MVKKIIHDFIFDKFPWLWFAIKYRVENEYQDYVYCKNDIAPYGDTRKKLASLSPVFNAFTKDRSFLEIGCDTGFFPIYAALLGAHRSLGVDRNERALGKARKAAAILNEPKVDFQLGVIPDLALNETFSTVLFMSTIHYMFSDKEGNKMPFDTMDDFLAYISCFVENHLLIEFVYPKDPYAQRLVSRELLVSGEYGEKAFIDGLFKYFTGVFDLGVTHSETRKLFLATRNEVSDLLSPLPLQKP